MRRNGPRAPATTGQGASPASARSPRSRSRPPQRASRRWWPAPVIPCRWCATPSSTYPRPPSRWSRERFWPASPTVSASASTAPASSTRREWPRSSAVRRLGRRDGVGHRDGRPGLRGRRDHQGRQGDPGRSHPVPATARGFVPPPATYACLACRESHVGNAKFSADNQANVACSGTLGFHRRPCPLEDGQQHRARR